MVFGFKKPSRSYASSQTSNYHPATGYPVGPDESRRALQNQRGNARRTYDESSSDEQEYGQQRNVRGRDYAQGQPQVQERVVEKKMKKKTTSTPATTTKKSRSASNHVSFESPALSSTSNHLDAHPFPTFRPTSSASKKPTQMKVKSVKKNPKKGGIEKQFAQFSVLDLAPPPPVRAVVEDEEEEEEVESGSERSEEERTENEVEEEPQHVPKGKKHKPLVQVQEIRRAEEIEQEMDREEGSSVTESEDSQHEEPRQVQAVPKASHMDGNGPYYQDQRQEQQEQQQRYQEPQPRNTPSPRTNTPDSRSSPNPYHSPQPQYHSNSPDPRPTPPQSELGRPASNLEKSYDANSPWNPVAATSRPPSRAGSALGREGVRLQKFSDYQPPEQTSGAGQNGTDSTGSSQVDSANQTKPRPVPGVSRSYKMIPRNQEGGYTLNGIELGRPVGGYEQGYDYQTELAEREEEEEQRGRAGVMTPSFAVQPPTPMREDQASDPMAERGMTLGQVEEEEEDGDVLMPDGGVEQHDHHRDHQEHHAYPASPRQEDMGRVRPWMDDQKRQHSASSSKSSNSNSIGTPPPPADPNQPAFLKWDQHSQRWVPMPGSGSSSVTGHPEPAVRKAESVVSSTSAYSQASAPAPLMPIYPQGRRGSLPALATSGNKMLRKGVSPGPSPLSRPSSPSHLRASSMGGTGDYNMILAPPVSDSFASRRMSIEPPSFLSPTTLTLLPEMLEPDSTESHNQRASSEYARSRPPSRAASIRSERMTPRTEGLFRPASSMGFSQPQPARSSYNFPSGYDMNQRLSMFGSSAYAGSAQGDYLDDGESRYNMGMPKPRAQSMSGGSRYAPSIYEGSQYGGSQVWRKAEKPGREAGLETISARGDPVPLLGADGIGEDGRGGYNSMILPTGAYKPSSDPTKNLNKLDARVLGMPTSTMSTITISGSGGSNLGRRTSLGGLSRTPRATTPAHLLADLPPPVSYSAHHAPPTKITTSQVLVQVYAVALDRYDFDMVREKSDAGSGSGKWIPGRSFVGRALEVGAEVRAIAKGDMVVGLVDIKKSGTLAEFITVDRRRIARTPYGTHLSLEQQACLPLLGVMAHRACNGVGRGARALVLNAHEGVGSLVCQELSHLGVHVTAQVPLDVESAEEDAWDNGAREVVADDPIVVLNGQHESGFEFVLDTYGGRRVYDAARRVLRSNGIFVTLYGDDADHLTAGPQVKSSLHALRRAFVKKDKKAISYIHLMPGGGDIDVSGQDSRDILEESIMGHYQPKVGMVVPFERAPDAFTELASMVAGRPRDEAGSIVVRLMN